MQRLRWQTLAACFVIAGTISVIGLRWWTSRGQNPIPVPLSHTVLLLALTAGVLYLGLRIRRFIRDGTDFDPIGAARTLALGQAAAITGAAHVGYFAAQLALALPRIEAPEPRTQAWFASAAIVAAGTLIAAGLITEWCCKVPPEEEDEPPR